MGQVQAHGAGLYSSLDFLVRSSSAIQFLRHSSPPPPNPIIHNSPHPRPHHPTFFHSSVRVHQITTSSQNSKQSKASKSNPKIEIVASRVRFVLRPALLDHLSLHPISSTSTIDRSPKSFIILLYLYILMPPPLALPSSSSSRHPPAMVRHGVQNDGKAILPSLPPNRFSSLPDHAQSFSLAFQRTFIALLLPMQKGCAHL